MKRTIFLLLAVLIAGCASHPSQIQQTKKKMGLYQRAGADEAAVVRGIGYPDDKFNNHSDQLVYVYDFTESGKTQKTTAYYSSINMAFTSGGKEYTNRCTLFLEFDYHDRFNKYLVSSWRQQGSDCP